ncbi:hypothetical protein Tco_0608642 [Tanacetum coccineum]
MSWLGSTDAYDEPIGSLGMMDKEVGNASLQSTLQILPSFEEYTPPVTYLEEVEETIGIPMEVKLEDLSLNTCSHDLFLSSKEAPSVDELEPQLLPNFPSLDVNLRRQKWNQPTHQPIYSG